MPQTCICAYPAVIVPRLGAGISSSQINVMGDSSGNFILTDGIAGDQVTLDGELNSSYSGVKQVSFTDGTVWIRAQLLAMVTSGTAGVDKLYGSSGAEVLGVTY